MSLPPSTYDKPALRRLLLDRRSRIDPADRQRWNERLRTHVEQWFETHPVDSLGVFWPIRGEPDLLDLYGKLAGLGVRLSLPVVVGKTAPLQFAAWQPGDTTARDGFGVPIPLHPNFVALPEALLVPCVGFSHESYRLGYGGGFYDRTLATAPKPAAIGIAYSCQQVAFQPDANDIALDRVITEAG